MHTQKAGHLKHHRIIKEDLVEDLLRSNFQQFRIDFYDYHYNGLDLMNEDKEAATDKYCKTC